VLQLDEEAIDGSGGLYSKTITRDYEDSGGVPGRYAGFHVGTEYTAAYGYDGNGRIGSVDGPGLPAPAAYTRVLDESDTYDTRLIDTIRIAPAIHLVETAYAYEANRDLVTEVVNSVDSVDESKYEYAYDPGRRRASVVNWGSAFGHSGEFSLYDYNGYGELIDSARYEGTDTGDTSSPVSGQHHAFTYDGIGNRDTYAVDGATPATDYASNTLNQYTSTTNPSESFTYDDDGNMTADGTLVYVWDGENRLIEVYPSSPSSGDKKVVNTYDYMNRRVRKEVFNHDGSDWESTAETDLKFVYDQWNVVAVLDGNDSDATLYQYTWGLDLSDTIHGAGGVGGLLAVKDLTGQFPEDYIFTYDGMGNIVQVLDDNWDVVAEYEYDAYGNLYYAAGAYADANPFRFSTKYYDAETGLYNYGRRYYTPRLGRWLNRDPIEENGGLNLYSFVMNRPVDNIDVFGLFWWRNQNTCQFTGKWEWTEDEWAKAFTLIVSEGESNFGAIAAHLAIERVGWTREFRNIYKCKIGIHCVFVYGTVGVRADVTDSEYNAGAWGIRVRPPVPDNYIGKLLRWAIGNATLMVRWDDPKVHPKAKPPTGDGTVYVESEAPGGTKEKKSKCCDKITIPDFIFDLGP
jgi:RHS repeat-associated protein